MEFDTQDKVIVGRVIDVDDIITFHATSVSEFDLTNCPKNLLAGG